MAYVSKEKKAKIAAQLKQVMPKDWKYSLAVRHHSTIVCTIYSAPIDLIAMAHKNIDSNDGYSVQASERGYYDVNQYYLDRHFEGKILQTFREILRALNTDNHDRSDIMTDYHDVGHYVDLNLGRYDRPFVVHPHNIAA